MWSIKFKYFDAEKLCEVLNSLPIYKLAFAIGERELLNQFSIKSDADYDAKLICNLYKEHTGDLLFYELVNNKT